MSSHTILVLCLVALAALSGANAENDRNKRLLSMFQVIRFDNSACEGDNNRNGTCYTKQECEDKDGRDSGSCADGFGVCCTFEIGCGEKTSENCTYFENQNPDPGSCMATFCPVSDNICQLRLDFITFQIAGPAVNNGAAGKITNGVQSTNTGATAGKTVSQNTQCLTDTFSASGSGNKPGVICGLNTGEHIYMDADEQCNQLNFNIGQRAVGGASTANRGWNVKVTQLQCDHPLLAPDGCTQYFYGQTTGMIRTFNWAGNNVHLADQMQKICIRNEQGMCGVCYTEVNQGTDFNLSGGRPTNNNNPVVTANCCGYGTNGLMTKGADCAQFGGKIFNAANFGGAVQKIHNVCGRRLGNANSGTTSASICQRANPFVVTFKSDSYEFTEATAANTNAETGTPTRGFELTYIQGSNGCT